MTRKLMLFLILLISIVSVSCVSAADFNNDNVIGSSDLDVSLDVEHYTALDCSDVEGPVALDGSVVESSVSDSNPSVVDSTVSDSDSSVVDSTVSKSNQSGSENKTGNGPQLDIKGPKTNGSELDIKGPKIDGPIKGTFDGLQVKINNAPAGSIINLFYDYVGAYGSRIQLNKDLTINGRGHTLDCAGKGGCSAFYSSSGNIILKNLRIINGHNDYTNKGGAIYITGSAKYTLENCTFENNWADDFGGAIYNVAGKALTIKNCIFKGNTADDDDGGAVYSNGEVNIENSLFDSNEANHFGGAIFSKKNVNIFNSTMKSNLAKGSPRECYGGAVCCEEDVYVDNSTFKSNYVGDYGGAIYARNIYVNNKQSLPSTFEDNEAGDNDGGALYAEKDVVLKNATLINNRAYEDGGAVFCKNAKVYDSVLKNNNASGAYIAYCEGGAIYARDKVYVSNSHFVKNFAGNSGGAICADEFEAGPAITIFQENNLANFIEGGYPSAYYRGTYYHHDQDVYTGPY